MKKLCRARSWYEKFKEEDEEDERQVWGQSFHKTGKMPGYNKPVESVMFIPYTPGSHLKQELNEIEAAQPFPRKIKFVETMGMTLAGTLCKKDPFPTHCGRECFMCRTTPGKCTRQGLIYTISCQVCKESGLSVVYTEKPVELVMTGVLNGWMASGGRTPPTFWWNTSSASTQRLWTSTWRLRPSPVLPF